MKSHEQDLKFLHETAQMHCLCHAPNLESKLVLYIKCLQYINEITRTGPEIFARNSTNALLKSESKQYTASKIQKEIRKSRRVVRYLVSG